MVWKPGQSGNYNGRPRRLLAETPEGVERKQYYKEAARLRKEASYKKIMDHFNSYQIANPKDAEYALHQMAAEEVAKAETQPNFEQTTPVVLEDPLLFQHRKMMDESLAIGLRISIAANLAPYVYPKYGLTTLPRFIETPVEVPAFQSIEEAENFLASLAKRFASSELGSQSALDLSTLVRNWISAKHAAAELELKRLNADASSAEQVIRIEGGLPTLPGTSIIMPEEHPSTAMQIESTPDALSPPNKEPADPAE